MSWNSSYPSPSSAPRSNSIELPVALVHLVAVLVAHQAVAEQHLERRLAVAHHRAHRQERVEPVAELAGEALGDEVGRDTTSPSSRGRVL